MTQKKQGPSKRLQRFFDSEIGQRTMFRPSGKQPIHIKKPGRNDPCPCGSGKKFKNCHLKKEKA
jgi:uncharacterized protein YecA (UPF0149 family)